MARPKFIQASKSFLKSPIASTETGSFVLNRLVDCYGNQIQTTDFSGTMRFTFDPGGVHEEIISATSFVINSDNTVTVNTGITRALKAVYPYTSGGTAQNHAAGTTVIVLPDNPQLFEDILAYIDGLVLAAAVGATDAVYGYVRTTENLSVIPRVMSALVSQKSSQPSMILTVQPFALSLLDKDVALTVATDTSAMVAPVTNPRVDLVVYDTVNSVVALRTGTENVALTTSNYMTYKPTPTVGDVVLAVVFHRVSETKILERDDGSNGFILHWYTPSVYGTTSIIPAGTPLPFTGRTLPTGFVWGDGSALSRTNPLYVPLFNAICPSQVFTVTIASPGVFTTSQAHSLVAGDKIHFTTTGGLPSGLSTNTDYYILSTGLSSTQFRVALSPEGTVVNTSGSQNGVHTLYKSSWGKGDGASTFNAPDLRGVSIVGVGATRNITLAFEAGAVDTANDKVAVPDVVFPSQGQPVTLTTTGTLPAGLATGTTYYIIRIDSTHVAFATTQANANAATPVLINITDTGSVGGVHTITYALTARTVLGRFLGEEDHGISTPEVATHLHVINSGGTAGSAISNANNGTSTQTNSGSAGSDARHNNMPPQAQCYWIIKL